MVHISFLDKRKFYFSAASNHLSAIDVNGGQYIHTCPCAWQEHVGVSAPELVFVWVACVWAGAQVVAQAVAV